MYHSFDYLTVKKSNFYNIVSFDEILMLEAVNPGYLIKTAIKNKLKKVKRQ